MGVPFAGGMSELRHITARTIVVSDKHRHIINLANTLAHPRIGALLLRTLRRLAFHPDQLKAAQEICRKAEENEFRESGSPPYYLEALAYFVSAWMGRNGTAGTNGEFRGGLSVRWDAGGGDSAIRYHSAVKAIRDWFVIMPRCTFVVLDVFDFLDKVKDKPGHAIYLDPPFPDVGAAYTHKFTEAQHRELADRLTALRDTRVVCRFYRHPLVEELYPAPHWHWLELEGGRTQTNGKPPEVLIVNGEIKDEPAKPSG